MGQPFTIYMPIMRFAVTDVLFVAVSDLFLSVVAVLTWFQIMCPRFIIAVMACRRFDLDRLKKILVRTSCKFRCYETINTAMNTNVPQQE